MEEEEEGGVEDAETEGESEDHEYEEGVGPGLVTCLSFTRPWVILHEHGFGMYTVIG